MNAFAVLQARGRGADTYAVSSVGARGSLRPRAPGDGLQERGESREESYAIGQRPERARRAGDLRGASPAPDAPPRHRMIVRFIVDRTKRNLQYIHCARLNTRGKSRARPCDRGPSTSRRPSRVRAVLCCGRSAIIRSSATNVRDFDEKSRIPFFAVTSKSALLFAHATLM